MPEAEAPSWLDAAFVQETLRRGGQAGALVESVASKPVGVAGDHYASAMYRVTAATAAGEERLIVKTMPPGENMKQMLLECDFFALEALMLSEVAPVMQGMLDEAAPGRFPSFAARCLHHGDAPETFIAVEDLAPAGYRLADRHRGLGLRHSLLALRTLARFHATSAVLLHRNPSLLQTLGNPYEKMNSFAPTFSEYFKVAADACRKCEGFRQEWADVVGGYSAAVFDKLISLHSPKPGRFNVICHGDFWMNNMMFRYEDGEVKDVRLVDFQISHVASPVLDLLYFLNSSVSEDVSKNYVDLLLREYHATLAETMRLLGMDAPTLEDILEDIEENSFQAVFSVFGILPIVKTEEVPDMEKMFADDINANEFVYRTPTIQRWLQRLLPEFERKGWLSFSANDE